MSIYDEAIPPKPGKDAELDHVPSKPAKDVPGKPEATTRRRGCGCGSCLLVFVGMTVFAVVATAIGALVVYRNAADWTRQAVVAAVEESDLNADDKREVIAQINRVVDEYKAGRISNEQLAEGFEELSESPLVGLLMAYAAAESYTEHSPLSDDEKQVAKRAFQRVSRGVFEKKIEPDELEEALAYISAENADGGRELKNSVSVESLRELIAECERVADEASIPDEAYRLDIGDELKRIIDTTMAKSLEPAAT